MTDYLLLLGLYVYTIVVFVFVPLIISAAFDYIWRYARLRKGR